MPIDRDTFSDGLLMLATALTKTLDDATLEAYYLGLRTKADPAPWAAFVKQASTDDTFRNEVGELWFPKLPDLIDSYQRFVYTATHREAPRAALPEDTRTLEEKRADARRMLEVIKATVGGDAGKDMPEPETVVVASDERMAELRRQARVIGGATAVAVEEIEGRA